MWNEGNHSAPLGHGGTKEGPSELRRCAGIAVAATSLALFGCSDGGSGASGENGGTGGVPGLPGGGDLNSGGVGGDIDLEASEVVAEIVATASDQEDFMLRATVPVPPGTFTPGQAMMPLTIGNYDMTAVPTQVEMVSRYPDPADGADVVEVIGKVRRPVHAQPGDQVVYFLGSKPQLRAGLDPGSDVRDLLLTPGAIKLFTEDVFGHAYSADLYKQVRESDPAARKLKDGKMLREWATHEVLLPNQVVDGNQGTMPHMMGVHAYITSYRLEPFLTLDLHVHNGMHGMDETTTADDALMEIYFKNLRLRLPAGWKALHTFDHPFANGTSESGNWSWTAIVGGLGNNKMHTMDRQMRFVRRVAIVKDEPEAEARARAVLMSQNRGFNRAGTAPNGAELYSWWNAETARYFPQKHRLPALDHIGVQSIRGQLAAELAGYEDQLATGASASYPYTSPGLGWAHPWGSSYGGMTGGDEINIFDGVETAWSASTDGFRMAQLQMRGYLDRQPTALYALDGRPSRLDDILIMEGQHAPYVPMFFKLRPNLAWEDPWGFNDAPMFQTAAVMAQGRKPNYQDQLFGFHPIDLMHYIRFTRNLKIMTWLGNDSLAKDQLEQAGELFRMSFHEYRSSEYGNVQVSSLLKQMTNVQALPGNGVGIARAHAWGIDTNIAAYSTGSVEVRERLKPWLDKIADVVIEGQSTCHGIIMSQHAYNYYDGQYRVRQSMESAFVENAMRGLRENVYKGLDQGRASDLKTAILDSVRAAISPPFWSNNHTKPWFYAATAPSDATEPEFCNNLPGHSDSFDHGTYYSSLAYAYQISGDDEFLFKASQLAGGGNLLNALEEFGRGNLKNTAALLALCQEQEAQ
ncbi:MAG: hypothetical protein GY711_13130 [bacterium]|nr:hypothetical protein [bacterium]